MVNWNVLMLTMWIGEDLFMLRHRLKLNRIDRFLPSCKLSLLKVNWQSLMWATVGKWICIILLFLWAFWFFVQAWISTAQPPNVQSLLHIPLLCLSLTFLTTIRLCGTLANVFGCTLLSRYVSCLIWILLQTYDGKWRWVQTAMLPCI